MTFCTGDTLQGPSAKELQSIADELGSTFDSRAAIKRPVETPDGAGGKTTVITTVATDVPCFYYHTGRGGEHEQVVGDRVETNENWVFLFPKETEVRHKDQIFVDDRTFEVGSTSGPSTRDIIYTVGAEELT